MRVTSLLFLSLLLPAYAGNITAINVMDSPYNALGNGTNDDTTAIQSALNACPRSDGTTYTGICRVFLPRGKYLVSSTLKFNQQGIILEGEGPGSRHQANQSGGSAIIAASTFSGSNVIELDFANVNFTNGTNFNGYMTGSTIRNLTVAIWNKPTLTGIAMYGVSNIPDVENVSIEGGWATSLFIGTSTRTPGATTATISEGVTFRNLYVIIGNKADGSCQSGDLTDAAVRVQSNETIFSGGKILTCNVNEITGSKPLMQLEPTALNGGFNNNCGAITIDGMSFSNTDGTAIRAIGVDYGGIHYTCNDIRVINSIFEGWGTAIKLNDDSSAASRQQSGGIYIPSSNSFRYPWHGATPYAVWADWVKCCEISGATESYYAPVYLGTNTGVVTAFVTCFNWWLPTHFPIVNNGVNHIMIRNSGFDLADFPAATKLQATQMFCRNCTTATVCTTGGSGHLAVSDGTNWRCD